MGVNTVEFRDVNGLIYTADRDDENLTIVRKTDNDSTGRYLLGFEGLKTPGDEEHGKLQLDKEQAGKLIIGLQKFIDS